MNAFRGDRDDFYRYRTGYLKFKSALCDRNTGMLSYHLLVDEVRSFFEAHEEIALLVAQLADLEEIEAVYGWQACDRLLQRMAGVVRRSAGQRYGEKILAAQDGVHQGRFILFLPEINAGQPVTPLAAAQAADSLRKDLEGAFSPAEFGGMSPPVSFACGSAVVRENPVFRFERQLHAALHAALPEGARRSGSRFAAMEREVRDVIRDEKLEFSYQPVLNLEDRRVVGYEALMGGPPGTLLERPAALLSWSDRLGLGRSLNQIYRRRVLEAADTLEARGLLFLNLAPSALGQDPGDDGGLSAFMSWKIGTPEQMVVTVAESCLEAAGAPLGRCLLELRALGLRLALGHAGSGYATLRRIQELKPDYVKIEPALVRGIDANLLQQEVVRSVVGVAGRVGSQVVAGELQSEAEVKAVQLCGVSLAQGPYLARPRAALPGTPFRLRSWEASGP